MSIVWGSMLVMGIGVVIAWGALFLTFGAYMLGMGR
jgi:hypothetical protein